MKRLIDGEFTFDVQRVVDSIDSSDVILLHFSTFRKAVVIDARSSETEGPIVRIMTMLGLPREHARSLRRLRAGFPKVRNLTLVSWPRYVDSLVTSGVWGRVVQRLDRGGHERAGEACEAVLAELLRLERAELVATVSGESYHTLWSARGQGS